MSWVSWGSSVRIGDDADGEKSSKFTRLITKTQRLLLRIRMVFGPKRIKFDARLGAVAGQMELYQNPRAYSFIHNFKVHFKRGVLQALANKVDVSISSSSPQLPEMQQVTGEFNKRMTMSVAVSNTKQRYSLASFHVTTIEYKESFAIPAPDYLQGSASQSTAGIMTPQNQLSRSIFCSACGKELQAESKFCNACGRPVA